MQSHGCKFKIGNENTMVLEKEFMQERMDGLSQYLMREHVKEWLMEGNPDIMPNINKEFDDMYCKSYDLALQDWDEENIENRLVELNLIYDPVPQTAERWRNMLKSLSSCLKHSQLIENLLREQNKQMCEKFSNLLRIEYKNDNISNTTVPVVSEDPCICNDLQV